MSLYFRPEPFTDKDNETVELNDIEITEYEILGDFQLILHFNKFYFTVVNISDFQEELEFCWNNYKNDGSEMFEYLKRKRFI